MYQIIDKKCSGKTSRLLLLAKEKNGEEANIPSSILFFGPKGNGKTTFALAFAEEIGCERPVSVKGSGMNSMQNLRIQVNGMDSIWYYNHPEVRNYYGNNSNLTDFNKKIKSEKNSHPF